MPSDASAATAKNQVPAPSPLISALVVFAPLIAIDFVNAEAAFP